MSSIKTQQLAVVPGLAAAQDRGTAPRPQRLALRQLQVVKATARRAMARHRLCLPKTPTCGFCERGKGNGAVGPCR